MSPIPAFVDTGVSLVDKSNVDKFLTPPAEDTVDPLSTSAAPQIISAQRRCSRCVLDKSSISKLTPGIGNSPFWGLTSHGTNHL